MPKTILVTGAAGDIGRALCRRFLTDGNRVVMLDRDEAALEKASEALGSGTALVSAVADVTDLASIKMAIAEVEERFGPIDVLVNNAGAVVNPTLASTDETGWLADIDLNLNGAWRCVRAMQDAMMARREGIILNISSANGSGIYGYPAYSAAKAGLEQLTRFLAVELGPYGIRANAIAPGTVKTQAWNAARRGKSRRSSNA